MHPPGHTRLPRYVRGRRGVVARFYGIYAFQDAMPAGTEAPPQPLYAVRFDSRELWGESAEANSVMYIDMWESYLEPA
jgi:nitrile hydratase